MDRVFEASPEQIWKILSDPALVPQWWGPAKYKVIVDKMDFRVGGEWRFISKDDQGNESAFHGVYKEIQEPKLISDTFNFEPIGPGHELLETMVLEDLGNGKTKATSTSKYNNIQDLEGMVNAGMEGGAVETWERLAELVER